MRTCVLMVIGIVIAAASVPGEATEASGRPGSADTPRATTQSPVPPAPGDANSADTAVFDELEAELARKEVSVPDPLEPVNRVMFGLNDVVYFWVLKPVVQVYVGVVPKPARAGIGNFFHNLGTPARLVNCILQGKNSAADVELARFGINTAVGVLGVGDPARDRWGLEPVEEDLGQTLAVHGLGDGVYLVWPLLGPSTLRDSAGMVGDAFLDPVRYVQPDAVSIGVSATAGVNTASFHTGEYETLKAAAVDPYIAMREAYLQYRRRQIGDEAIAPARPASPMGDGTAVEGETKG
jgi:phospholipid-binding lipoprotein MlaA